MTPSSENKRKNFMAGVHLGINERTLLLTAPGPAALGGQVVEMPGGSRSDNQALQKAARRLADLGLLFLEHIQEATRAQDPRLALPYYEAGRFWLRADQTRRQLTRRAVIWLTPLGEGVALNYRTELSRGTTRRWTQERVARAQKYALLHPVAPNERRTAIDATAERLMSEETGRDLGRKEAHPPDVLSREDRVRWRLAARAARKQGPKLGSKRLWEKACATYRGPQDLAELRALVGERPPGGREPRLRSFLGEPHPTASELRRRAARDAAASQGAPEA